jgi:hypothetical protein
MGNNGSSAARHSAVSMAEQEEEVEKAPVEVSLLRAPPSVLVPWLPSRRLPPLCAIPHCRRYRTCVGAAGWLTLRERRSHGGLHQAAEHRTWPALRVPELTRRHVPVSGAREGWPALGEAQLALGGVAGAASMCYAPGMTGTEGMAGEARCALGEKKGDKTEKWVSLV